MEGARTGEKQGERGRQQSPRPRPTVQVNAQSADGLYRLILDPAAAACPALPEVPCLRGYWLAVAGDGTFTFADTAPAGLGCPLIVARAGPGSGADGGTLAARWPFAAEAVEYGGSYTAADGGSVTLDWSGCALKYVVPAPAPPRA